MTGNLLAKYGYSELRPEHQLLLLAARCANSAEFPQEYERLLKAPIDWLLLMQAARKHRLVEMLYWTLRRQNKLAIPESLRTKMTTAASATAVVNKHLLTEVVRISKIASKAEIPLIHMKGPTLAVNVYGDSSLRHPGDLDVLIPREHMAQMLNLLKTEEYRPTVIESNKPATWEILHKEEVLALGWAVTLRQDQRLISVDLHWRLMKDAVLSVPTADTWNARSSFDYQGNQIPIFEPSMNFLYLARHAAKHGWTHLRWVADLIALTDSAGFDFDELLAFATKHRYRRFVLFALELVRRCPGTKVPDALASAIEADPVIRQQSDFIWQRLFVDKRNLTANECRDHLSALEDDRIRAMSLYADALLIPTLRDWERMPIAKSLFGIYYLLRPLRLFLDYVLPRNP